MSRLVQPPRPETTNRAPLINLKIVPRTCVPGSGTGHRSTEMTHQERQRAKHFRFLGESPLHMSKKYLKHT